MATVRISRVVANSQPAVVRLSRVAVVDPSAPPPPVYATVRLSRVAAQNAVFGDVYIMRGGIWQPTVVKVYKTGAWV